MMRSLLLAFTTCIYMLSCQSTQPVPDHRATEHVRLDAFRTAVAWPAPEIDVVAGLINQYTALGMHAEAAAFFGPRAAETLGTREHPWLLAASALFEVLNADAVPLLRRRAHVEAQLARLDEAVAEEEGLARYLRGIVQVSVPPSFDVLDRGIEDLEWVVEQQANFPAGIVRGALRELANAYTVRGEPDRAERALAASGHAPNEGDGSRSTGFSVRAEEGFRFSPPRVLDLGEGLYHAEAYDFGDIGFIETPEGLVIVDAGTFPQNAMDALQAVRTYTTAPLRTLVLTHGHWDHMGGAAAYVNEGAEVVASALLPEAVAHIELVEPPPFRWFFGNAPVDLSVTPDVLIEEPTTLATSRTIELIPVVGGETHDAVIVHVPDAGAVWVGDVFMPYLGAPFTEEGDPEALLDTIDRILALEPSVLLHGHPPLTELWTVQALPGLRDALTVLINETLTAIADGRPVHAAVRDNVMPASLADTPQAVMPYLVMREGVIKRLYDLRTGYWQADREGIELLAPTDWARALDHLGASESSYARAAESLLAEGEAALPLRLLDIGLVQHPSSTRLAALREQCLHRLRALHQLSEPFRFIVYSETTGVELQPLSLPAPLP